MTAFAQVLLNGLESHDLDLRVLLAMVVILGFLVGVLAARIQRLRQRVRALAAWAYESHRWSTEVLLMMNREHGKTPPPPPPPKELEP